MRIEIANKLRPFSHECGSLCLIPSTSLTCEVFPAKLRIVDLSLEQPVLKEEIPLNIKGPVSEFTVLQDLEKMGVDVWGKGSDGYFRYRLQKGKSEKDFSLIVCKAPEGSSLWTAAEKFPPLAMAKKGVSFENLSFGVSKMQQCPHIQKRNDPAEIFPLIYRLGQSFASEEAFLQNGGTASILHEIRKHIEDKNPLQVAASFELFLLASFQGMLVPTLYDHKHQGLDLVPCAFASSPLPLLVEAKKLIKQMLVSVAQDSVDILPCLIPDLHCGRMLNCSLRDFGLLDFEWSKKVIRRMIFKPQNSCSVRFSFHKGIKTFRLRNGCKDRGNRVHTGERIDFIPGKEYFFDNFQ